MTSNSETCRLEYEVGDWVLLSDKNHKEGVIMYIGPLTNSNNNKQDIQYGIELTDFSVGTHSKQGHPYFECKDKLSNRCIFMSKTQIKRRMRRSDFRHPNRLQRRQHRLNNMSIKQKQNIFLDPITSLSTTEIIEIYLGKYWLRYICLFLPTLDKFVMPAVCKLFHNFVTVKLETKTEKKQTS